MKKTIEIPNYEFSPFLILEGGRSLHDGERYLVKSLNYWNADNWVIDNLYEDPSRLAAMQFLKPKTIILGTTGVYREKLEILIDLFFSLKLDYIENVILTISAEDVLWGEIKKLKKINKKVKFFTLESCPSMFDDEGEKYEIAKLKL